MIKRTLLILATVAAVLVLPAAFAQSTGTGKADKADKADASRSADALTEAEQRAERRARTEAAARKQGDTGSKTGREEEEEKPRTP